VKLYRIGLICLSAYLSMFVIIETVKIIRLKISSV